MILRLLTLLLFIFSTAVINGQILNERIYFDNMFNGEMCLNNNDYKTSIRHYKKALKVNETKQAYLGLTKAYSKKNKVNKAYKNFENYIQLEEIDQLTNVLTNPELFNLSFDEKKWYKVISDIHFRSFSDEELELKHYKSVYEKITYNEYIADINILYETIKKIHPGVYWYISQSELEHHYNYYVNKFNNDSIITSVDVYKSSIEFVEKIKCGHSAVQLSQKQIDEICNKNLFFPFPIKIINNSVYIFTNDNFNKKIISINNINTKDLLKLIHKDNFGDGFSKTIGDYDLEQFFDIYFTLYLGSSDSVEIELLNPISNEITIEKYAMIDSKISQNNFHKAHQTNSENFQINYNKKQDKATIRINSFTNNNYHNDLLFEKTYDNFFKTVNDSNYQNVVIDLRDNLGGYYQNVRLLLSYFIDEDIETYSHYNIVNIDSLSKMNHLSVNNDLIHDMKMHFKYSNGSYTFRDEVISSLPLNKYHFNGNVYILISGKSFSGSSLFTSIMNENYNNLTIIGNESGGGKNGTTAYYSTQLTLPNSNIEITIPMVQMVVNTEQSKTSGGVIPDYETLYQFKDYINNIDKENKQVDNLILIKSSEFLISEIIEFE